MASGGVSQINNPSALIAAGQVIPGNPAGSPLYNAVASGAMPIGSQALTSAELSLLSDWITAGAQAPADGTNPAPVTIPLAGNFTSIQANILAPKCLYCHSSTTAKDGVRLDSYNAVKKYVGSAVQRSKLYEITASGEMPPNPNPHLNSDELNALSDWIAAGAPND